jgi:hypothetical protein
MTADAAMVIFSSTIEEESASSLITDNLPQLAVKNSLCLLDLHARSIPSTNRTAVADSAIPDISSMWNKLWNTREGWLRNSPRAR